jgi:thiosulfate/3-mercaptopyruvate sulfurtransferase
MSRSDVLVDADWVEAHLDDPGVVLVEVDEDTAAYDKGHIRNAVKLDWRKDLQDPVRRDFVDRHGFEQLLSERGISNDDTVVLYGGNNNWFAAYAYWYFRLYGHQGVKLLDGGRKKWELESREMVTAVPERRRTSYRATEQDASLRAMRDEVIAAIGKRNLVDVRSPDGPGTSPPPRTSRGPRPPTTTGHSKRMMICARCTRARRAWTSARTPSPTAGSASAAPTRGSCCTSCSGCRR